MKLLRIVVIFMVVLLLGSVLAKKTQDCNGNLAMFLKCNNQRIIEYLQQLTERDQGSTAVPVQLTNNTKVLTDSIYIGNIKLKDPKSHLYLFRKNKHIYAYAWVEKGGTEINLPTCQQEIQVLSGDVYTWKVLRPGDGVIKIPCFSNNWLTTLLKREPADIKNENSSGLLAPDESMSSVFLDDSESVKKNSRVPKFAEVSIPPLFLENPESIKKISIKQKFLFSEKGDSPRITFLNADKSETLYMIFCEGDCTNCFSQFRVKKGVEAIDKNAAVLSEVKMFATGKAIKLGMTKVEVIKILGGGFKHEKKKNLEILSYIISDPADPFLRKYNLPEYQGRYTFKGDQLIDFFFGFPCP